GEGGGKAGGDSCGGEGDLCAGIFQLSFAAYEGHFAEDHRGPCDEHGGEGRTNRGHEVDGEGNIFRIIGEDITDPGEHTTDYQEEGSPRGVDYLQLVCTQYKFTAVPKRAGPFSGEKVHNEGHGEHQPSGQIYLLFEVQHT